MIKTYQLLAGSGLVQIAAETQQAFVWLVMRSSAASIAFYRKMGFRKCGETVFKHPLLKPKYQDMWVMKKTV